MMLVYIKFHLKKTLERISTSTTSTFKLKHDNTVNLNADLTKEYIKH